MLGRALRAAPRGAGQRVARPYAGHGGGGSVQAALMIETASPAEASNGSITSGGASAITSSVLASRTSGTAPLYVHFDATGTTSSVSAITLAANGGAFRNILHAFDFGDSGAGNWTQTGLSRNTHSGGPITAHVFETPGTYTVNVTHTHAGTGAKTATPITITVADPNVTFAGTLTICVSNTLESSGGPAGCAYTTSAAVASSLTNNRRYLYKRGQTHTVPSSNWNGCYIGAYGSGADPIISTSGIQQFGTTGGNVVQNCYIRNLFQWVMGQHNLLARCTVETTTSGYAGAIQLSTHADSIYQSKYTCFFENSANSLAPDETYGGAGFWGICAFTAFLGNAFGAHDQHSLRMATAYKMCFQNNYVPGLGPYTVGQMLKVHAANTNPSYVHWDEVSTANAWVVSEKNVISNNIFGSASSTKGTLINLSPQNTESVEDLNDFIFENNEIRKTSLSSQDDIGLGGARMTERGNFRTGGGSLTAGGSNDGIHNPRISGPYFHI